MSDSAKLRRLITGMQVLAQVAAQYQAIIHAPGRTKADKIEALKDLNARVDEWLTRNNEEL